MESTKTIDPVISKFIARLSKAKTLRKGRLAARFVGDNPGIVSLKCGEKGITVSTADDPAPPLIELIGNRATILAVLDGKKEGRKQYRAGGFLLRGDMAYASAIALELGIVDKPFYSR